MQSTNFIVFYFLSIRFLYIGAIGILDQLSLCCGGWAVHYSVFSNIPDSCPQMPVLTLPRVKPNMSPDNTNALFGPRLV